MLSVHFMRYTTDNYESIMDGKSNKNNTFENLSKGLTASERKTLLNKMDTSSQDASDLVTGKREVSQLSDVSSELSTEDLLEISSRLKKEPLLFRIYLWFRALFTDVSVENIFNGLLVRNVSVDLQRKFPGLCNLRRQVLCNIFYEKLLQVKHAADFFRKYMDLYRKNPGAFYVSLAHIIMPEAQVAIEQESDPFQISLSENVYPKIVRSDMIQKLQMNLAALSATDQKLMYHYAQIISWMDAFVRLPLDRMVSKFSREAGNGMECPFSFVKTDFQDFSKVMCNYVHIDDRILSTFVLHIENNSDLLDMNSADKAAEQNKNFRETASSEIAFIEMFTSTVPMDKLSKIVLENALYTSPLAGGNESWFEMYSTECKNIFRKQMDLWERDFEKEKLKSKLKKYFELNSFPVLPIRPWEKIWNGMNFTYEFTLGFLYYFVRQGFRECMPIFKSISLEGRFANKDNPKKFSEALDSFNRIYTSLETFSSMLSTEGDYGSELSKCSGDVRKTDAAVARVNWLMSEIETDATNIIRQFKITANELVKLLTGFISDKVSGEYASVTNLSIIGRKFGNFPVIVRKVCMSFSHALEISTSLEIIEKVPSKNGK